jgi:hypothetical protein
MNPSCFSQIYLCLYLPLGFLTKTLCISLPWYVPFPSTYLILLDLIILTIFYVKHKQWKSSLCTLPQSPVTSSCLCLGPLKMKAKCSFKISATAHPAKKRHIPQDYTLWTPPNLPFCYILPNSNIEYTRKNCAMEVQHSAILVYYLSVSFPFTTSSTFCNIMTSEWVSEGERRTYFVLLLPEHFKIFCLFNS